jgi:vitamin-K-epoxide reductase (warfarin-sensitive)
VQTAVSAARNGVLFAAIAILSLAGVVDSAIALQRHYAKSATQFCDISQQFSCDIVNRSEYSTIQGIPVAAIGVLGYAAIFLLATFWKARLETPNRLLIASVAGFVFALYLTYIEAHELMTWCILCLLSQGIIFLICALAVAIKLRSPQP